MRGRARTSRALLLASDRAKKSISLALQGGGAHGAFTWGVLDAILEDGRLGIEAITGTSAGAMNAVILADGWIEGGVDGARTQLEAFWRRVSLDGSLTEIQRSLFDRYLGFWCPDGSSRPPLARCLDALSQPVRDQSPGHQSAPGSRRRADRLRALTSGAWDQGLRHSHERLDRQRPGVRAQRTHRRSRHGLGLFAHAVPSGRD